MTNDEYNALTDLRDARLAEIKREREEALEDMNRTMRGHALLARKIEIQNGAADMVRDAWEEFEDAIFA